MFYQGGHLGLESFLHLGKYGINDRGMTHTLLVLKSVAVVVYCKIFFMLGLKLSHRILVHSYRFLIKLKICYLELFKMESVIKSGNTHISFSSDV